MLRLFLLLIVCNLPTLMLAAPVQAQGQTQGQPQEPTQGPTQGQSCPPAVRATASTLQLTVASANASLLRQSWLAYRDRFIQADGRVVDWENTADLRSTSEGQAYAMLRAVWINDRDSFDRTLKWAEENLARRDGTGQRRDQLWSWKWGKQGETWGVLDANYATDADVDAAVALIWAARRWNCSRYLDLARVKLRDIWTLGTAEVNGKRYLLPGPPEAFWQQRQQLIWNPSYFAPSAYRLFAQIDRERDWRSLIAPGYEALRAATLFSAAKLPADWIVLNPETGQMSSLPADHPLKSIYSFDAYRVWWRLGTDLAWHRTPEAREYLRQYLPTLVTLWRSQQRLPARLDLDGKPASTYEATSHYAMVYSALLLLDPTTARQIYQRKVVPQFRNGLWDNNNAYYANNMVWFALLPWQPIPPQFVR